MCIRCAFGCILCACLLECLFFPNEILNWWFEPSFHFPRCQCTLPFSWSLPLLSTVKWHEFLFRYFRHAAGSVLVLSKNLAQYINTNRLALFSWKKKRLAIHVYPALNSNVFQWQIPTDSLCCCGLSPPCNGENPLLTSSLFVNFICHSY